MVKTLLPPSNPLHKRQCKGNTPYTQLQTIFQYLQEHIATASMVADATGIYQKNICRFKSDLEKAGRIWELEKKPCRKTGFKAWYLTTNPDKVPKHLLTQLNLF